MTKIVESHITKFDYETACGYVVHWFEPQPDGAKRRTKYFGKAKYGTWKAALEAAQQHKQRLMKDGLIDLNLPPRRRGPGRPRKSEATANTKSPRPNSVKPRLQEPALESLLEVISAAEKANIFSLSQLRNFIQFARHQGYAQVHLIEAGIFQGQNTVRSAYAMLGHTAKSKKKGRKPLVKTGTAGQASGAASGNEHLAKPISLTKEGERLLQRLVGLLKSD